MQAPQTYFANLEALSFHIQNEIQGCITLPYDNCGAYEGMVLGKGIIFDSRKGKYELDLQWISFGLDLFGENLLENYLYAFESLEKLIAYLSDKYGIQVGDIPLNYRHDPDQFPNPIKDKAKEPAFEAAWQRFQMDFQRGDFLDASLNLVYSTQE